MFNVRAVIIDHYISKSISELYDQNDSNFNSHWLEPVIRIFGSTPNGVKSCVHVHGVYPYIYVPCKGGDACHREALILGAALDEALKMAYNQHKSKFVYKVVVTSGIPLYGYHSSPRQFFKIYFYNPYHIRKACELLVKGAILGQKLQPHEAHIPYVLQFMMDYNVYGMSFVGFSKIKYRRHPGGSESPLDIKEEDLLPKSVKRTTFTSVEVDAFATDITNKGSVRGLRANPGLQGIWEGEKIRRRNQNRTSQFTVEETQPRQPEKIHATEAMFRERLCEKLKGISAEKSGTSVDSAGELRMTYPAVVSKEDNLLEASVLDEGLFPPRTEEADELPDISLFISEQILSQMQNVCDDDDGDDGGRGGGGVEVDGAEAESILCKFQEEEEAELENDDGGDMTQPLETKEDGTNTQHQGEISEREEFWHNMADKILQVDGGQDSSSDSDSGGINCHRTVAFDSITNLMSTLNETNGSSSNSSTNSSSLPFVISQTSPTCWSSLSPRLDCSWLTQNQEPCSWDKNEINFTDYFSPRQPAVGTCCDFSVLPLANKPTDDANVCESLGNLFSSSHIFDTYAPMAELNVCSNLESGYSDSPTTPLTTLTPSARYDCYADTNMNVVHETTSETYKSITEFKETQISAGSQDVGFCAVSAVAGDVVKRKIWDKNVKSCRNPSENSSAVVNCQNKPVSLTLKQYLKDFGDVVSVDLKNFSNQEMVVVEYKPFHAKTGPNKFLIKPLDKFLENWDVAEKKINEEMAGEEKEKSADASKARDNKETEEEFDYAVKNLKGTLTTSKNLNLMNNNVVSAGENVASDQSDVQSNNILSRRCSGTKRPQEGTSYGEGLPKESDDDGCRRRRRRGGGGLEEENKLNKDNSNNSKKNKESNERKWKKRLNECKTKADELLLNNLNEFRGNVINKKRDSKILANSNKSENFEKNVDANLINEINSCFEDYFKRIVKVNNSSVVNANNLLQRCPKKSETTTTTTAAATTTTTEEDDADHVDKSIDSPKVKNSDFSRSFGSENLESLKFVAQLLSVFSNMSETCEIPPLSITINIGHPANRESAPVQLNLQPSVSNKTDRKVRRRCNKPKKNFKIENVDGPVDGSSSSSSSSSSEDFLESPAEKQTTPSTRWPGKKKRDWHYKSLNVVLQKSATKDRKRKRSGHANADVDEDVGTSVRRDTSDFCSQNPLKDRSRRRIARPSAEKKVSPIKKNFTKPESNYEIVIAGSSETKKSPATVPKEKPPDEPDIIYDSDTGNNSKKPSSKRKRRKLLKFKSKKFCHRIPETVKSLQREIIGHSSSSCDPVMIVGSVDAPVEAKHNFSVSELEVSASSLDKTLYRIPAKWDDTHDEFKTTDDMETPVISDRRKGSSDSCKTMASSDPFLCSPANSNSSSSNNNNNVLLSGNILSDSLIYEISNQVLDTSKKTERSTCSPGQSLPSSEPHLVTSEADDTLLESPLNETLLTLLPRNVEFTEDSKSSRSPEEIISLRESKIIVPKAKPPSRIEVETFLVSNENMKEINQVPYYSDPKDVTKAMEIGPLVLKVETNANAGLKPFKSNLNLSGTEERRARNLNHDVTFNEKYRYLLVRDRNIKITPLRKPPFSSDVMKCLSSKKVFDKGEEIKQTKRKVFLPLSPGQESQSEEELDLSLSASIRDDGSGSIFVTPKSSKVVIPSQSEDAKFDLANFECAKLTQGKNDQMQLPEKAVPFVPNLKSNTSLMLNEGKPNSDNSFQIKGPTLENTYGFDNSVENLRDVQSSQAHQYVTMMVMEVHVQTRKDLRPDPQCDPLKAVFYTATFDSPCRTQETGIVAVEDGGQLPGRDVSSVPTLVHWVPTEKELVLKFLEIVRALDPDILAGYEIEMHSWGYLVQRAFALEMNLISLLGRISVEDSSWRETTKPPVGKTVEKEEFEDVPRNVRNMRISGRILLDVWRVLRHEVALTSYTFENVAYHILHERHPLIWYKELSFYWEHESRRYRHITADFYLVRVLGILRILDHLDFVNRTSEFARLFGIQFYEVLSRGSQFRVESMMLRIAKPLNYVSVSPNVAQRAAMRAPASLPLILEPQSAFYSDPIIVLDFQSLYPSMIIAYNYCFSTCLGRVDELGGADPFEFGCTRLQISREELKDLENDITISPAGVAFVKSNVRKGILPAMLEEILETRLMVKKSMKYNKNNKLLLKVLHAQQLGLKLIANVTYGYTAANFSGRMPCIEVGDSVVSKGRETLQRTIELVKSNSKWGARVVYGDTDSIFVLTPGKTRAEAFQIGAEIAEAVTQQNPKPVKLKLEKVYQPSILQTKKRYVGYMYESPEQEKPTFEAKGIETVRRDGCPAVGKVLQKALEILFDTRDVSLVKKYTIRQFSKLLQGRVNVQDLIFAKEYRGRHGYRPGACVPALELARQWTRHDKRAEPRVKERVPYVIVNGPPGVPLIKLVRSPKDLLSDSSIRINAFYYITKALIPPLNRCFSLIGVDVAAWYEEMPKKFRKGFKSIAVAVEGKKSTISQYFPTVECVLCSAVTNSQICRRCQDRPQAALIGLIEKARLWEMGREEIAKVCRSCCKSPMEFDCRSMDCPVLFRKTQALRDFSRCPSVRKLIDELLQISTDESTAFEGLAATT